MSAINLAESFSGLVAFAETIETGSFARAGRKTGLSASAIGKSVERLEQRLGVRLLNRTTRSVSLTREGEILHRYVVRILKDIQEAEREIQLAQDSPRGRLKISVPTVMGRRIVLLVLREFQAAFPEVTIDITLDDLKVDVIEEGYDVVLRLGDLEDSSLQARRVAPHRFITCASPTYLAQRGTPQIPSDLHAHCCIHYRFSTTGRPEVWAFKTGNPAKPIEPGIILNDGEGLASAALGGLGIVQAPNYLVEADIAAGRLQPVLEDFTDNRGSVWLVWPPQCAQVPRVRAFVDFMADRIPQLLKP
jgi:DNA-binding transcriptional LysR family regulator